MLKKLKDMIMSAVCISILLLISEVNETRISHDMYIGFYT